MISYIQNKLQKHNKVVFFTILAVIIVAFVFMVDGVGPGGGHQGVRQDFFGYNLQSERDVRVIIRDAQLSHRIASGQEHLDSERFQNFALERIAYLGVANQLRIPGPTDEQMMRFVATRQAFLDDDGRFDNHKYSNFIDEIDAHPQTSTADVARVIEQDYRIERARDIAAGPGYALPTEVRLQLERTQTLWSLDVAKINFADFTPEIEVTDEQLEEFFDENSFRYEREPRVSFSYALFPNNDFLERVSAPSEHDLQRHFEQHRQRFADMKEAARQNEESEEENEPEEKPEITLADVRDEVEKSLRRQRARRLAGEAAADFAYALFLEPEARPETSRFEELLQEHGGELREAPPASQSEFPPQIRFPRAAQQAVFRLSDDRDFSDPVELRDDYIVLIYHETLPSYLPPFEDVREAVERDYRNQERRRLVAERGEELRENILQRMEEGASFVEAAEADELEIEQADSFSRMAPPTQIDRQLLARLEEFEPGKVSPVISQDERGFLVYVRDREVPEIDTDSSEFIEAEKNLRSWSSMVNQHQLLQEFIEHSMRIN